MASLIQKLFPGETIVCIAGGPSLTDTDVECVRGRARVIAVNDSYLKAPFADVLYACDKDWWLYHRWVPSFQGLKVALDASVYSRHPWPADVTRLANTGPLGLERDPGGLRTGRNSGYQAINLAVHLGAARILLLGYDMQRGPKGEQHWFGKHPSELNQASPFVEFLKCFPTLLKPLAEAGVEVVNCSPRTALTCFPQMPIDQALKLAVAA